MGLRSPTESIALIYRAFLRQRTWPQAELAREVEIGVQALRKRLDELTRLGMPLDRDEEPPQVYWSVPGNWFPGGRLFNERDLPDLLHLLWHAPRSRRRDRLFRIVLGAEPDHSSAAQMGSAILTREASEAEEAVLAVVEQAILDLKAVRIRFHSRERSRVEERHISVHRVDVGPPVRLIATCHRTAGLKWFRLDNIVDARSDAAIPFRPASGESIERFQATSIDGFREPRDIEEHVFTVRDPAAKWVERNLLPPMAAEKTDDGITVTVRAAGALRVARFVVGLGDAANAETESLRVLVEELAKGALRNASDPSKLAKTRAETAEPARRRANR